MQFAEERKILADADDAQLVSYIDMHYGTFSARNYDIAIAKSRALCSRLYHPI
ncbi:hypothetical protein [Paracerasibacillus soli]|uniref:Uncharacterized protein n=1 Tax=Paracerasibacillus soli TaxID=480284 RepID=A0ABU5CW71_9BACI|nr:hypothetical protein [Virgibacillus soli]MDY0410610.1 hypothetical protein [Virgibacillus soli]